MAENQEFVPDFLEKLWWRRGVIISLSLPLLYTEEARAMYTPHWGFQMVNQKHERNEWQGKVVLGDWFSIRYMRKGKRPPTPPPPQPPTKCHKICFALFIIWLETLPTLHSAFNSKSRCWNFPSSLGWLVPSPQTWIWTFGTTFPSSSLV